MPAAGGGGGGAGRSRWSGPGRGRGAGRSLGPLKGLLHTIKGNSAMMGLTPLQDLAHAWRISSGPAPAEPDSRDGGAQLLVRGTGLLADLVRGAAPARSPRRDRLSCEEAAGLPRPTRCARVAVDAASPAPDSSAAPASRRRGRGRSARVTTIRVDSSRLDALLESVRRGDDRPGRRSAMRSRASLAAGAAPPEGSALEQAMLGLGTDAASGWRAR